MELDALFREMDSEPEGGVAERGRGFQDAAGTVASNRAERRFLSKEIRAAKRAGTVLMVTGVAVIAAAFLTMDVSLSLFLFLNIAPCS